MNAGWPKGLFYPIWARVLRHGGWQPYMETMACKTKRPGLDLSLGTFVDQPSPKCCSRRRIDLPGENGNGP